MKHFLLVIAIVGVIVHFSIGFPHRDDPYRRARRREKQARKAYKKQQAAIKFALFGAGNGGSSGYKIPEAGGSSSNYPPIIPFIPSGSEIAGRLGFLPPIPTDRVNSGLSTVISGVKNYNVGEVLTGLFTFSTNDDVRSVANTVIGGIFSPRKTTPAPTPSSTEANKPNVDPRKSILRRLRL